MFRPVTPNRPDVAGGAAEGAGSYAETIRNGYVMQYREEGTNKSPGNRHIVFREAPSSEEGYGTRIY